MMIVLMEMQLMKLVVHQMFSNETNSMKCPNNNICIRQNYLCGMKKKKQNKKINFHSMMLFFSNIW
jgi:hypothetical protein